MIKASQVKDILEAMYPMRRELVPCFIGDPGIGKTAGIYEFAEKKGVKVVTFILSNTVPSEVSGIRMPDHETKRMEVFDDMRMASLEDGDILFFDEILEAPPMLWSACLTLIQDRIMASGRKLPDVFIVAASNPVVNPTIIPASVRDRFQFIELKFDQDDWLQWMKEQGVPCTNTLAHMLKGDSDQYNILTPRRAYKLLSWLKKFMDDGDESGFATARSCIDSMFGSVIADYMKDAILHPYQESPVEEQVKKQVREVVEPLIDFKELPDGLFQMDLSEIFNQLKKLDSWPQIESVLAYAEFKK